jgi:ribonuclease Z
MASHVSFDKDVIGEMTAGVRLHYKGMFAFGVAHTVVNVTKDRLWIREAALPTASNTARANPQWILKDQFDGKVPEALPPHTWTVKGNQEQAIRDLEIKPDVYTPKDQLRQEVREWPADMTPAKLMQAFGPPQK